MHMVKSFPKRSITSSQSQGYMRKSTIRIFTICGTSALSLEPFEPQKRFLPLWKALDLADYPAKFQRPLSDLILASARGSDLQLSNLTP